MNSSFDDIVRRNNQRAVESKSKAEATAQKQQDQQKADALFEFQSFKRERTFEMAQAVAGTVGRLLNDNNDDLLGDRVFNVATRITDRIWPEGKDV